jgi:hypothetical protein
VPALGRLFPLRFTKQTITISTVRLSIGKKLIAIGYPPMSRFDN